MTIEAYVILRIIQTGVTVLATPRLVDDIYRVDESKFFASLERCAGSIPQELIYRVQAAVTLADGGPLAPYNYEVYLELIVAGHHLVYRWSNSEYVDAVLESMDPNGYVITRLRSILGGLITRFKQDATQAGGLRFMAPAVNVTTEGDPIAITKTEGTLIPFSPQSVQCPR